MSIAIDHYSVLHLSFVVCVHSSIDQRRCGEVCVGALKSELGKFFSGVNFFVYGPQPERHAVKMNFDRGVIPSGRARIKV